MRTCTCIDILLILLLISMITVFLINLLPISVAEFVLFSITITVIVSQCISLWLFESAVSWSLLQGIK